MSFGQPTTTASSVFGKTSGTLFGGGDATKPFGGGAGTDNKSNLFSGQGSSGFGAFNFQAKTTASTGLFSTPATTSAVSAFGASQPFGAFNAPPVQTVGSPGFGQPQKPSDQPPAFGASPQTVSAFGSPATQASSLFGSPSTSFSFGKTSGGFTTPASGFSAPQPATSTTSSVPQTTQAFSLGTVTTQSTGTSSFGSKPFSFGSTTSVSAPTAAPAFGTSTGSPGFGFGQTQAPQQQQPQQLTLGTPTTQQTGLNLSGQTSTFPLGSQGSTAFGSSQAISFGSSTPAFVAPTQLPTLGTIQTQHPAFGSTQTTQPSFGTPTFVANQNTIAQNTTQAQTSQASFSITPTTQISLSFGTPAAQNLATSTTPAFGVSTLGASSTTPTPAFGATATPSTQAFGAPQTSISLGVKPQTSQPLSFGTTPSSFGTTNQLTTPVSFSTTNQPTTLSFGTAQSQSTSFGTSAQTTQASTLSFGTAPTSQPTSTTSLPGFDFGTSTATTTTSGLSFGTGLSFAKPASTATTSDSTSVSAPSGITALGKSTTATMPTLGSITTTSTAAAAPPVALSSITFAQLEENINKWTLELEEQERTFINQATQINAWDRLLVANGEKILELNDAVETVKNDQSGLELELNFIVAQQQELETLLGPLEKKLHEESGDRMRDPEREHMYSLAETLDTQLRQMSEDLKDVIEHLNETNRSQDTNDPIVQIGRILNAHMSSMQWIDNSIAQISTKLDALKATHDTLRRDNERSFQLTYN